MRFITYVGYINKLKTRCIFSFSILQPIEAKDDVFWDQFWSESVQSAQDVFTLIPAAEIRALREESPSNLATLCYKAVEKLVAAADSLCNTHVQQQTGYPFLFLSS